MTIRKILLWPDAGLCRSSAKVSSLEKDDKVLIDDMIETMQSLGALGISAPQFGISKKISVIDLPKIDKRFDDVLVLINPSLRDGFGERVFEEGCLSVPTVCVPTLRAEIAVIEYEDVEGEKHELNATGLLAAVVQHEIDHLQGDVIVEKLSKDDRKKIMNRMESFKKDESFVST